MSFLAGFSKTATDWKAKAGNAIAAYQKPVTALAATHYLYSRGKEHLDKKRGMKKTALHNSFIDETEAVMADGRPIPKGIETELTEKPGWVKGKRGRKVDRVLRENPVDKTAESKHPRVSQPLHSSFAVQCGEPMTEPVEPKVKSNTRKAARAAGMLNTQLKPETVNSDSGGTYLGSTAGDRLP